MAPQIRERLVERSPGTAFHNGLAHDWTAHAADWSPGLADDPHSPVLATHLARAAASGYNVVTRVPVPLPNKCSPKRMAPAIYTCG